jgi:CBS domain-containing protein
MHDVAEFLHRHEPFQALDESALEELARRTEVEFFAAGAVIFAQGASAREHVRVIRRGSVELLDDDRVLDLLGEGELFGHPSMLSGLPTELAARAAEDTLCYRLHAADVQPLLARPAGLRYVARSVRAREALVAGAGGFFGGGSTVGTRAVRTLVTRPPLICAREVSIRDVARQMAEAGVSCALVRLDTGLGIVTDRDLRERVIAVGLALDAPVGQVMTAPAVGTEPDRPAADAALLMLERGVRHLPVVTGTGEVLGVVSDLDILAAEARTPFMLRRRISAARTPTEVRETATGLPAMLVSLYEAGTSARQLSAVHSIVADAIVTRLTELLLVERGRPDLPLAWVALGSHGRRELVPGSDLDSAVLWPDGLAEHDAHVVREVARRVVSVAAEAGFAADDHGATAAARLFARSSGEWSDAVTGWIEDLRADKVPLVLSAILDGRALGGAPAWRAQVASKLSRAPQRDELARWMLRLALAEHPPTGFLRNAVLEHGGRRRRTFDVKRGGLRPIVDLARYAGFIAEAPGTATRDRLRAAGAAGVLTDGEARVLAEAHELFFELRVEHHVDRLRHRLPPDDDIDPAQLNDLSRRYVKDAFRAIAGVQRGLARTLALS